MADNTNWNGWVTPDIARNPGLATDAYNSKVPNTISPILSHAAKGVATSDAINDHAENNNTQTFWARLGSGAITGLEWLGKPLKEIQRDYKFVHSVYTDHGFLPGFTATLGILGAGVVGAAAGPLGAVIAADVAGAATRKALGNVFKDSYAKSEDENYKVSPGRDFSNVLSKASSAVGVNVLAKAFKDTNKGIGKIVSGGGDIAFDIISDPIQVAARFGQLMKAGKLVNLSKAGEIQIKYPIMESIPGVKNFIISRTGAPLTSEQMDLVRESAGKWFGVGAQYNRALEDLAKSTAGEIVQKYPQLGTVAAGRIGALKDADEVHNFLKTSLYFGELNGTLAGQAMMPGRTLLRSKLGDSKVVDYLRNDGSLPGKVYKTFSGYMPYSVDAETQKLSLTKFRWNSNDAATTVYRIARIGMGDKAAKEWAGQYAQAVIKDDLALARSIKNNAIAETFKALGLPEDSQFVKTVWDDIQKLEQPVASTQIYGVDYTGKPLGQYVNKMNENKVGGIVKHQAQEMFDIPDFLQIKRAMREAGQYSKFVGRLDDFTAKAYTNSIFKPLALATAGFGLRVAAAEMIPTFARFGVMNTLKAKIAVSAAKQKYDLLDGEKDSIFSAALVALGMHAGMGADIVYPAIKQAKELGLQYASKMLPDDMSELAMRLVMANNGHFLSDAVTTGHGYDASTSFLNNTAAHYYYQIQKNSPMFRDLPEYTTYSSSDIHYVPRLTTNLNKASKEVSNSRIAQDILKYQDRYVKAFKQPGQLVPVSPKLTTEEFYNTPEFMDMRKALVEAEFNRMVASTMGKFKPYDAERKVLTRWKDGDLHQFAEDRVDATLGMFVGKDGTFHQKWAENVANGLETDLNDIAAISRTNPGSLPAAVAGPMLQPYVPSKGFLGLNYITNLGFKKVIDPIVNGLAREPLYMIHVADAYKRLETQITKGWLGEDQALRIAQTQASYAMLPQIHNTALRNQFAQLARNFLPFYFAQEQALKRAFNALKDTSIASPLFSRGMRFYQLAEHAMSDPTFMTTDENGNKFINIPLVGEFGKGVQNALGAFGVPIVTGLPITVKGSTVSLKSVLPELQTPGVSPFMAISGNLLADFFPSMKGIVQGTVGDISFQRGVLDSLVPAAWAKTALAALSPIDLQNQMNNALASALASAYYNGQVPDANSSDWDRQSFVDRIKNNARSILLIKTFLNLVSPLAPQVKQEDPGLREEFWKMVKANNNNFADALQQFIAEHGSRSVSYTVGKTESVIRGLKLPYIQETVNYIKDNKEMFNPLSGVSTGAFYLIPQDNFNNESDRAVYGELMNMHLRTVREPKELLRQFYIAQGYAQMSPLIKQHVAALQNAQNIPALKRLENDNWSAIMTKMKNLYPIWYSDYTNPDRRTDAQVAVTQLNKIFASENAPKHEQAVMVKELLDRYNQYQSQQAQFNMMNIRGVASQMSKQDWEDYLMTRAEQEPRLNSVIYGVFLKLG